MKVKQYKSENFYYDNRQVMGYCPNYIIFILLGGRGIGKTFSTQNMVLGDFFRKGRKTLWLRLKEPSTRALLANDAANFIDTKLIEKWNITEVKTKGSEIWFRRGKGKLREFGKILALSTYYIQKGVALNKAGQTKETEKKIDEGESARAVNRDLKKYYNIILDELAAERSEKKTFDISYAFVNQIETVARLDTDRRIVLMGNTLEEGCDILARCFGFIPNEFGIHKLKSKRTIVHYIEDSAKYKEARKSSIAGLLMPEESTFTNKVDTDFELVTKKKAFGNPTQIFKFDRNLEFLVYGNVVTKHKPPKGTKIPVVAMIPYMPGIPYFPDRAKTVINMAQQRLFEFDMLLTLKQFYSAVKVLKSN